MKASKQDKTYLKGLIKIIQEGKFELQVREIPAFTQIYNWVLDLESRFDELPQFTEAVEDPQLNFEVAPEVEQPKKKARKKKK